MSLLIGIPLLALLTILQSSIVNNLTLLDGRPDLVLLAVIGWSLTGRGQDAMVWGLIGGLFLDTLSGFPYGLSAVILIVLALLVSALEERFWEVNLLMPVGVALVASISFHGLHALILWITGYPLDFTTALYRIILPSTFLNLLLALPASQLAQALKNLLYPPEVQI